MGDPNRPKKAPSAYFLFMSDVREQVTRESEDKSVTAIGKKLGELWRALSDEEKEKYKAKQEELKAEAAKALEAYKETDEFKAHQEKVQKQALKIKALKRSKRKG